MAGSHRETGRLRHPRGRRWRVAARTQAGRALSRPGVAWGVQGALAVIEQGTYSLVSFAFTILLARWLRPSEFGAFSLAFSAFLIGSGYYNALLLEPAMVLGPSVYGDDLHGYLRHLPALHWRLTVPLSCIAGAPLVALTILQPQRPLPRALLAAVLCLPLMLRIWLARRVAYIVREPRRAVAANILYAALVVLGLSGLRNSGHLSAVTAFLAIALASAVSAIPTLRKLGLNRPPPSGGPSSREILRAHWRYGHWIVWATLAGAISLHGPDYFAGAVVGLGAAGALSAMEVAALPVVQALTALGFLALPSLAMEFRNGDITAIRRKVRLLSAVLAPLAGLYAAVILLLHRPLEQLVFGGKYAPSASLLAVMAVYPIFMALGLAPSLFLRAVQHPQHYLLTNVMIAPVGILASLLLTLRFGLAGAAWSIVIIYMASWFVASFLATRWRHGHGGQRSELPA